MLNDPTVMEKWDGTCLCMYDNGSRERNGRYTLAFSLGMTAMLRRRCNCIRCQYSELYMSLGGISFDTSSFLSVLISNSCLGDFCLPLSFANLSNIKRHSVTPHSQGLITVVTSKW